MQDLQIRRRRLDQAEPAPEFNALYNGAWINHLDCRDRWQRDRMVDRFVVIEGNLGAFAARGLLSGRLLPFAVAVRRAAAVPSAKHKILFARDAPATHERREDEERKKRAGESAIHHSPKG